MKSLKALILLLFAFSLLAGCTITHAYGPYSGKVVDAETNEPIEGAVVLITFFTERYTLAGFGSEFADALETMTDRNGEFKIPAHRVMALRIPHRWKPYGYVVVFKPGFGCYPEHKGTSPMFMPNWTLPPSEYVAIKLPKLETIEERKENLHKDAIAGSVPDKKRRNFLRLQSIERVNVGLRPYPVHRYGGHKDEK